MELLIYLARVALVVYIVSTISAFILMGYTAWKS